MRLSYGLAISAALITGGTAIYYAVGPRLTVTAPDVVELKEGINERKAAVATWPFTGTSTGGWSFTRYATQNFVFAHADMKDIMDEARALVPLFVDSYTATSVVYHTATGLWDRLGIGDHTSLYTVAVRTNGVRVYSDTPTLTIYTGTLWEVFSVLQALTTTARQVSGWYAPTYFSEVLTNAARNIAYSEGPQYWTNPAPAWYTNFNLEPTILDANYVDAQNLDYSGYQVLTNAFPTAIKPFELNRFFGFNASFGTAGRWITMNGDDWTYNMYRSNQGYWADRYIGSNGVNIANLSTGVSCSVLVSVTASITVEVQNATAAHQVEQVFTAFNHVWTGMAETVFQHTGVATGWLGAAWSTDQLPLLYDLADVSGYRASGYWNDVANNPVPTVNARLDFSEHPAIIHWKFERCRP
jgi:hypothetical protein